eukprot:CCRYP_002139-RA/>CCRYP_002139-RA protein AED:0.33 eAED:0.33 QI:190/1/1/1/1/1/3/1265/565
MSTPKTTPTCTLDRDVLNENTVGKMDDLGLSIFAKLCGFNRGAFVMDPPDGKTYGCLSFPESFSTNVNLTDPIPDSVSLTKSFASGNITASQTVDIVDQYVSSVYSSSGGGELNPYGCDVNGLATLEDCPVDETPRSLMNGEEGVKAVTLAGAFVPAPWATGGKVLSMEEVKKMYSAQDFQDMVDLSVNAVQIPVPRDAFAKMGDVLDTLSHLMNHIERAGLAVVIVLVNPKEEDKGITDRKINDQVTAAANYVRDNKSIIAIQVPSALPSLVSAVRTASSTLPILVPINKGELNNLSFPPDNYLFAALDVGASTSVADIASSDSVGDRLKMFYHENIVCIDRSPIEWLDCYKDMPAYITSGFDLAVDDCIHQGEDGFKNYGQCDRFDETIGSGWWERHRKSLASRQLFTYSKGLGWSFSGWKLYEDENPGVIDSPAKLLCLRDVASAGLFPSLTSDSKSEAMSCLNGPVADFALGDATLAPTLAPPPDCGNGWWNFTTKKCDYWIPPPPTPSPTEKPTMPCPSCEEVSNMALVQSAAAGAVVALVLNWAVKKMFGRHDGYETLP